MTVFCQIGSRTVLKEIEKDWDVRRLSQTLMVDLDLFYVVHNGYRLEPSCSVEDTKIYHFIPRILGGKGGFGSMLRAIGAQIEKTTSREACRDLSGRRMRDVNNEKKLKDWISKEADREREREERRQERLARRLAGPKHNFDDPEYHKQRSKVQEDLDDALQKGLKRVNGNLNENSASTSGPSCSKKMKSSNKEWLGVDLDSDDLESDSDSEAYPGPPDAVEVDGESQMTDATEKSETLDTSSNIADKMDHTNADAYNNLDSKRDVKEDIHNLERPTVTSTEDNPENTLAVQLKEEPVRSDDPIDLDQVCSASELALMGLERLKNALMVRGLKCGGSLEERADRLFSVKGLTPDQFPSALIAKSKRGGKKSK